MRKRLLRLWGFLLVLKLTLLLFLAPLAASIVGNASTSAEFFALLARPGIQTIYLTNDVSLNLADAPELPVNLTSNLTISVTLPEPQVASLAANYIASKIRLAPYITLTFERLVLSGSLRGTGQHVDLLARSDGGAVIYNRTTNHRTACLPFELFYKQLASLPLPLAEAGGPLNINSRDFALRNATRCWLDAAARNVCMTPYLDMVSYGAYNSIIDGVIGNGGYNSFFVNSHGVCDKEISVDCIRQRGADLCLAAALAAQQEAAVEGGGNGGATSSTALAVGLGVGLGGALLLAVLLVAVFARFHFLHRRDAALAATGTATASPSTRSKAGGLSAVSQNTHGGTDLADLETASGEGGSLPPGSAGAARKPGGGGAAAVALAVDGGGSAAEPRLAAESGGAIADGGGGKGRLTAPTTGGSTEAMGSISSHSSGSSSGVTVEASSVMVVQRVGASEGNGSAGLGEVEAARLNLLANAARGRAGRGAPLDVKVLQLLGQGSFGKVYKGIWHGTLVALKAQVLPPSLSGDARRRHMAVMEAAISSAINHPSIVQTYCYSFRPIKDTVGRTVVKHGKKSLPIREEAEELSAGDAGCGEGGCGSVHEDGGEDYGHELLLVLEYCDGGSLRAALDKGVFHQGRPWPWDWRRAIQAAGQAAAAVAAGAGPGCGRPPSQQQHRTAQAAAAAAQQQQQGDSTAIANLVAAMTRGAAPAPASGGAASGSGTPPSCGVQASPSPPPPPPARSAAAPARLAAAPAAAPPPGRNLGGSRTVEASELGSSMWPRLDTYEPDFTHGAFEVVLPTADDKAATAGAAGDGDGDAAAAGASAAAAAPSPPATTTLNVVNTLAGAPTAATSFMSSFSNAFDGAGTSAADNAAAAAAADRLAMMYLLQQAAAAVAAAGAGADPAVGGYAKMLADYISSSNLTGLNTSALAAELASSGGAVAPLGAGGSASSDDTLVAPPPPGVLAAAAAAAAAAAPPPPPPPTAAARSSAAASVSSPLRGQASLRGLASSGGASAAATESAAAAGSGGAASAQQPQPAIRYGLMLAVAADVASGLLHLHLHGVVHGDVKASNVLLKQIVVSDPLEAAGRAMDAMSGGNGPLSAGPSVAAAAAAAAAGLGVGSVTAGGGGAGGGGAAAAAADLLRASSVESADRPPRLGLCAKVSDFGLSTMLSASNTDTHISATTAAGSLSHMSPELLLCGHVSKANDVYAYGILLFELFTGERAWEGMPRALLPARVALEGWRPVFPPHTPAAYRQLAERCWLADPGKRPTFEEILTVLRDMRETAAAESQPEWVAVANPQLAFMLQLITQQQQQQMQLQQQQQMQLQQQQQMQLQQQRHWPTGVAAPQL